MAPPEFSWLDTLQVGPAPWGIEPVLRTVAAPVPRAWEPPGFMERSLS